MVGILPWTHTLAPGSLADAKTQRYVGREPSLLLPVYTEPFPGNFNYRETNNACSGDLQDMRQLKIP